MKVTVSDDDMIIDQLMINLAAAVLERKKKYGSSIHSMYDVEEVILNSIEDGLSMKGQGLESESGLKRTNDLDLNIVSNPSRPGNA